MTSFALQDGHVIQINGRISIVMSNAIPLYHNVAYAHRELEQAHQVIGHEVEKWLEKHFNAILWMFQFVILSI